MVWYVQEYYLVNNESRFPGRLRERHKVLVENRDSTAFYVEMYQDKFSGKIGVLRQSPQTWYKKLL